MERKQISNSSRDAIKPDLTMFLHYEILDIDEKQIVAVHIQRGISRPYYLGAKGLKPTGVYVRQGTSSVPASDAAIRILKKMRDKKRIQLIGSGKNIRYCKYEENR